VAEACGVDVTFGASPTTTVRYRYTYNPLAQVSQVIGRFEDVGPDDVIDYVYDDLGHATSTIETRGAGYDRTVELAAYAAHGELATYTLDQSGPGYHDVTTYTFDATTMTIVLPGEPAQHYTLAYDASERVTAAVRDDGRTTTYVYDEELRTATTDTAGGAVRGVIHYDAAGRELGETWSGSDPSADHRETVFDYDGDRVAAITFRAGEPLAPVEVELPLYTCE